MLQQIANGLFTGAVYSLFAIGFTLVFGVLRQLNLAHAPIFTAGAFVGIELVSRGLWIWLAVFRGDRRRHGVGSAAGAASVSAVGRAPGRALRRTDLVGCIRRYADCVAAGTVWLGATDTSRGRVPGDGIPSCRSIRELHPGDDSGAGAGV